MRLRDNIPGSCCGTYDDGEVKCSACENSSHLKCCGCSNNPSESCPPSEDTGSPDERRTDGSGSCKRDNSSPDEFLTTDEELELDCDCDDDDECDEGYSCKNKNKCSGTRDVKAEYEFEE